MTGKHSGELFLFEALIRDVEKPSKGFWVPDAASFPGKSAQGILVYRKLVLGEEHEAHQRDAL